MQHDTATCGCLVGSSGRGEPGWQWGGQHLDVLVNASRLGKIGEVEGVCKGLLGYPPEIRDVEDLDLNEIAGPAEHRYGGLRCEQPDPSARVSPRAPREWGLVAGGIGRRGLPGTRRNRETP